MENNQPKNVEEELKEPPITAQVQPMDIVHHEVPPVVELTATLSDKDELYQFLSMGADFYLPKYELVSIDFLKGKS